MSLEDDKSITQLLAAAGDGDATAFERLWRLVYSELHGMAEHRLGQDYDAQRLRPTELLHEAFLRLVPDGAGIHFVNRRHFFAAAAEAMRRIRIDDARKRRRAKRGGGRKTGSLGDDVGIFAQDSAEVLAVGDALETLARLDRQKADIVNLRYFSGFTVKETAAALELSQRTVINEWRLARAWLHRALSDGTATTILE